jgi:hypothetical protein
LTSHVVHKWIFDVQGTGNVEPLGGALLGLAEATSGGGRPSGSVMDDLADVAAEFPKP